MTLLAIWCRHKEDSIIGIGKDIPWHIKSDFKRFQRMTTNHSLIVGQTTYETFPNHTLPNRKIYVLSFDKDYEVSDKENHFVVNDIKDLKQYNDEEMYVAGGASVYKLFFKDLETSPDYVIDCVYQGDIDRDRFDGEPVTVKPCVDFIEQHYIKIDVTNEDNVDVILWVKKDIDNPKLDDIIERIKG